MEPYPVRFDRDATAAQLQRQYAGLAPGTDTGRVVRLAGRMLGERRHGGLDFADLRDETGTIQLLVTRDEAGQQALKDFSDLDLGDWIGVEGTVMASDHGELSVRRRPRSSCCPRPAGDARAFATGWPIPRLATAAATWT